MLKKEKSERNTLELISVEGLVPQVTGNIRKLSGNLTYIPTGWKN